MPWAASSAAPRQPHNAGAAPKLTRAHPGRRGGIHVRLNAPEHGVAAWFVLLSEKYGFAASGRFSLEQLARKYAGRDAKPSAVNAYIKGWSEASGGRLNASSTFRVNNAGEMLDLGKAMFEHEIGKPSPLSDAQIIYGIEHQRNNSMPA